MCVCVPSFSFSALRTTTKKAGERKDKEWFSPFPFLFLFDYIRNERVGWQRQERPDGSIVVYSRGGVGIVHTCIVITRSYSCLKGNTNSDNH